MSSDDPVDSPAGENFPQAGDDQAAGNQQEEENQTSPDNNSPEPAPVRVSDDDAGQPPIEPPSPSNDGGADGGDDGNSNGGDEIDEDEESLASIPDFLPPDHPLLARVQAAMKKELLTKDNAITLQLREKSEALKKTKEQRENLGVELYTLQQQLAKKQIQLEEIHQRFHSSIAQRESSEEQLKSSIVHYKSLLGQFQEQEKKSGKIQKELDQLKLTIQQIEQFNSRVSNEISITKRTTYSTEESMKRLENEKIKQDEMIVQLKQQISSTESSIELYDAQIENQQKETRKATETLGEANREIYLIEIEKKEYLDRWRQAVLGVNNRDDAQLKVETMKLKQMEEIHEISLEIDSYKKKILSEQALYEKTLSFSNRIENEGKFLESQLEMIKETYENFQKKYLFYKNTLESLEEQLKHIKYDCRVQEVEISQLTQACEKEIRKKQQLESKMYDYMNSQTTMEKGAANVWKLTQQTKKSISEKEIQKNEIENELARIRVDSFNTKAHNKELQSTLMAYQQEIQEKDHLIERYEQEIRQRHDKIEKKQIHITRLNKKYEQITSSWVENEHSGPKESIIKNLQKEIQSKHGEMTQIQKLWLKTQMELVQLNSLYANEESALNELSARKTIYQQKRIRYRGEYEENQQEIGELSGQMKSIQGDLGKLNEFLHLQGKLAGELQQSNETMEFQYQNRLKDNETRIIDLDSQIHRGNHEKSLLLEELIEVEKQVLLWEKKILLEKETQSTINPEYGQSELSGMKKEIHRMKLRQIQLKKQQEEMVGEMERLIQKREFIALNQLNNQSKAIPGVFLGQPGNLTSIGVKKQILSLKKEISDLSHQHHQVIENIQKQEEQNQLLMKEFQSQQAVYQQLEGNRQELEGKINGFLLKKQMAFEATIMNQKRAKRLEALIKEKVGSGAASTTSAGTESSAEEKEESKRRPRLPSASSRRGRLEGELNLLDERFSSIRSVVEELAKQDNNPRNSEWFKQLLEFL